MSLLASKNQHVAVKPLVLVLKDVESETNWVMSWWLCPSFKYRLLYREPVICLSLSHQFQTKVKSVPPFKKNRTMFLLADWRSTDGVSSTLLLTSVTCGSDLNWDVCYNQSLKFYFECLDDAQVLFFFHLKILKKKWPNKSAGILQKGFFNHSKCGKLHKSIWK